MHPAARARAANVQEARACPAIMTARIKRLAGFF